MNEQTIFLVDGERARRGSRHLDGATFVRLSDDQEIFVGYDEFDERVSLAEED